MPRPVLEPMPPPRRRPRRPRRPPTHSAVEAAAGWTPAARPRTVLQHVAQLAVLDAPVRRPVVLHHLLDLGRRQLRLLADGEHDGADEARLRDDAAAQAVVVAEVLDAAHAVLEDRGAHPVEDVLQRRVERALRNQAGFRPHASDRY